MKPRYETTLGRAALALLVGAASGAVIMALVHLGHRTWVGACQRAAALLTSYFVEFSFGTLVLAAPAWWLLHRLGRRDRISAVILGVTLTLGTYLAVNQYTLHFTRKLFIGPAPISWASGMGWTAAVSSRSRLSYWLTLLEGAVWYAIVGGLVGLLVWSVAYRPSGSEGTGN